MKVQDAESKEAVYQFLEKENKRDSKKLFIEGVKTGSHFCGQEIKIEESTEKLFSGEELSTLKLMTTDTKHDEKISEFNQVFLDRRQASTFAQAARIAAGLYNILLDVDIKRQTLTDKSIVSRLTISLSKTTEVSTGGLMTCLSVQVEVIKVPLNIQRALDRKDLIAVPGDSLESTQHGISCALVRELRKLGLKAIAKPYDDGDDDDDDEDDDDDQ